MSIRPTTSPALADQLKDPAYSAYVLLRTLFTVAPILFGLDKFFNLLTHPQHWNMYLAGWINDLVPGTADQCMYLVGAIEIVAGVLVAVAVAAGWRNDDGGEFLDNYLRVTRRAKAVVRKVFGS